MRCLDMTVVISEGRDGFRDLKVKGLDILLRRQQMHKDEPEAEFESADDLLRRVVVCSSDRRPRVSSSRS